MNIKTLHNNYDNTFGDITNELTEEIDKFLLHKGKYMNTYINKDKHGDSYALRYPGATRGHITVDENDNIIEIKFYCNTSFGEDDGIKCYNREVETEVQKFIGYKFKPE